LLTLMYCNITSAISFCTTPASRVFVDLDAQQVRDFKTKLTSDPVEVGKVELKEDNPNKSMVTLFDLTDMMQYECNKDKTFYFEETVVGMADGKDWYYIACSKCYKRIDGHDSCSKCGPDFREAIPCDRWSENVTFTVIGHNAEKMLKYTAEEHVEYEAQCEKVNEPGKAVRVFDRIMNETFVFKVSISEYNISNQSDNFKVLKVCRKASDELESGTYPDKGGKRGATRELEWLAPRTPQKPKLDRHDQRIKVLKKYNQLI
ncbi:hypothetical protein MKW98_018151, partial [Papaver atlanticum]